MTGGWFHSGVLACGTKEGYVHRRPEERHIISGGENIHRSMEKAIFAHLAFRARWCRRPDDKGRIPVAIVSWKEGEKSDPGWICCAFSNSGWRSSNCRGAMIPARLYRRRQRKIVKRALAERY